MTDRCVCSVNDDTLCRLLAEAQQRVLFVAPGTSKRVANALAQTWTHLGANAVSVVLDVDPEVCRLGYGAEDALDVLQRTARELGQPLCEQPGVRIGLLIVDDKTLVYSPTPLLVESNTTTPAEPPREQGALFPSDSKPSPPRPNAILLQGTPPELARDLGAGPDGEVTRNIGLDQVPEKKVQELKNDLRENPPLKFDIARYERVFNSQLEFVEMEVLGCSVSRRTANIPADLMGLAQDDETWPYD